MAKLQKVLTIQHVTEMQTNTNGAQFFTAIFNYGVEGVGQECGLAVTTRENGRPQFGLSREKALKYLEAETDMGARDFAIEVVRTLPYNVGTEFESTRKMIVVPPGRTAEDVLGTDNEGERIRLAPLNVPAEIVAQNGADVDAA